MKKFMIIGFVALITAGQALASPVNMTCIGKVKGKPITYEVIISNDRENITYISKGKKVTNKVIMYDSRIDLEFNMVNWETMKFYDKNSGNIVEAFVGYVGDEGLMTWESENGHVEDTCVLSN